MTRALDLQIAERVLGWRWLRGRHPDVSFWEGEQHWLLPGAMTLADVPAGEWTEYNEDTCHSSDGRFTLFALPCWSTDMSAAWQVVDRMLATDGPFASWKLTFRIAYRPDRGSARGWAVDLTPEGARARRTMAATAPLAICQAALRTLDAHEERSTRSGARVVVDEVSEGERGR